MKLNDSMLQISKNLEELKQCLVNDVDEPVHKNVPVHVKNYHFKTSVISTLYVFQVAIFLPVTSSKYTLKFKFGGRALISTKDMQHSMVETHH